MLFYQEILVDRTGQAATVSSSKCRCDGLAIALKYRSRSVSKHLFKLDRPCRTYQITEKLC